MDSTLNGGAERSNLLDRGTQWFPRLRVVFCAALLGFATGCPEFGLPTGDQVGDDVESPREIESEDVTGEIVSLKANLGVSALVPRISVFYSVTGTPDSIAGFHVCVADPCPGPGLIDERRIIPGAEDLPAGANKAFNFEPAAAGVGFFRVGILITVDDEEIVEQSEGIIQVQGPPDPFFIQPAEPITVVERGREGKEDVFISFDAGDPEGDAQWRLFYLSEGDARNNPPDELGTEIRSGSGNVGFTTLATAALTAGTYELGISATDSGSSIPSTVANGDTNRIVTIPNEFTAGPIIRITDETGIVPPALSFSAPASGNVELFRDQAYTLRFSATVSEPGATGEIELFYDDDKNTNSGFKPIKGAESLPASTTSFKLPTDLPENTDGWFIGATIRTIGGVSLPVTVHADGLIIVVRDPTLEITEPDGSIPVAPSTDMTIRWTTNAPDSAGKVDVFAQTVDASSGALGPEVPILSDAPMATRTAPFNSDKLGRHRITVRLEFIDNTAKEAAVEVLVVAGAGRAFWLEWMTLAKGERPPGASDTEGQIFEGVNFQDNAGTFLTTVGDMNGDRFDDFLIGARFGKPFFIEIGEAYLIFGSQSRSDDENEPRNLNSVALAELRGIAFPGPRVRAAGDMVTDGLSAVQLIPDQDGDQRPEIALGFPFIDSRGHSKNLYVDRMPTARATLERPSQFTRGGIVFISSRNPKISNPPAMFSADPDDPLEERAVIYADLVGQNFDDATTDCAGHWVDEWGTDQQQIDDRPVFSPDPDATDGCRESYSPPSTGFTSALAGSVASSVCRPCSEPDAPQNVGAGPDCDWFVDAFYVSPVTHRSPGVDPILQGCVEALGITAGAFTRTELDPLLGVCSVEDPDNPKIGSGFYPLGGNAPREPFGARIIGAAVDDRFGASLAVAGGFIIMGTPNRTPEEIEVPDLLRDDTGAARNPDSGLTDSGLLYMFNLNNLWPDWNVDGNSPPVPFQYQIGLFDPDTGDAQPSQCGRDQLLESFPTPFRIVGENGDRIEFVSGLPDFNQDGREDFAVGAPDSSDEAGAVFLCYRRDPSVLEGNYILAKLSLGSDDLERLAGVRINGRPGERFGEVIGRSIVLPDVDGMLSNATLDFNGDGLDDFIIGNPNADEGRGEVVIVFATNDLISPEGGVELGDLLACDPAAPPDKCNSRAVRIVGENAGDAFGFNVAIAGDFNGDGTEENPTNDLLVAAPSATVVVDTDGDGIEEDLAKAGKVYLILGAKEGSDTSDLTKLVDLTSAEPTTISIENLGEAGSLQGLIFLGREKDDELGGGRSVPRSDEPGAIGKRSFGIGPAGDVDGDGFDDILLGSILADPEGRTNAGEVYLIYGRP